MDGYHLVHSFGFPLEEEVARSTSPIFNEQQLNMWKESHALQSILIWLLCAKKPEGEGVHVGFLSQEPEYSKSAFGLVFLHTFPSKCQLILNQHDPFSV